MRHNTEVSAFPIVDPQLIRDDLALLCNLWHLHSYLCVISLHKLYLFGGHARVAEVQNSQIARVRVSFSVVNTNHHEILESLRPAFEVVYLEFAQLLSADGRGVILHIDWY